jgi:hypothetical protein
MPGMHAGAVPFTPSGYQGAAQHTFTPGCDGFHEPGQCKTPPAQLTFQPEPEGERCDS